MSQGLDRTFTVTTLGCKLNQYESECIRQNLVDRGWEYLPFDTGASFFIINTCTVTGKTDSRCRNMIRRARRISAESIIIVTGCYAETQGDDIRSMDEPDLVLGNSSKGKIPLVMEDVLAGKSGYQLSPDDSDALTSGIDDFLDHSRAFIKVQEGCDSSCSYCIIPRARGKSRSIDPVSVVDQVKRLEANGCEEVVLTGIHIGRFGKDLDPKMDLVRLLELILSGTNKLRVRLSSIEQGEVNDDMIGLVASSERVASHLHIPLQSGDDSILKAMNRPYDTNLFRDKIEKIKVASPGIAVGTDVIVGFPGETDENFRHTYEFLRDLAIDYFHVFSFSRRPGTKADLMNGQIEPEIKKSRSKKLIRLGKRKRRRFMESIIGQSEIVLVQGKAHKYSRFSTGLTGNYCEVSIKSPQGLDGKLVPVEITHYSRGRLYGRISE